MSDTAGRTAREYAIGAAVLAAGGAAIIGAQPWAVIRPAGTTLSGSDLTSGGTLVLAGAAVAALALRALTGGRLVRLVLQVVTAALGVLMAVLGGGFRAPSLDALARLAPAAALNPDADALMTGWPWAYAVAAGLLALAALAAPPARRTQPDRFARGAEASTAPATDLDWWRAQDAGEDPTASDAAPTGSDVGTQDTMGDTRRSTPDSDRSEEP